MPARHHAHALLDLIFPDSEIPVSAPKWVYITCLWLFVATCLLMSAVFIFRLEKKRYLRRRKLREELGLEAGSGEVVELKELGEVKEVEGRGEGGLETVGVRELKKVFLAESGRLPECDG